MRLLNILSLSLAATLVACTPESAPRQQKDTQPATVTATAPQPPPNARDQYAFAAAVAAAQRIDLEEDPNAYHRTWTSWNGKRYRWELAYVPLLCRSAEACVMAPFDHARSDERIVQGWLPRLRFDDATHADLQARCQGKKRCIVTVEGTMKLTLSSQEPTSIAFEQPRIVSSRAAAASESWIVARR